MKFWSQYRALLYKNWILWKRKLFGSLCEVLFPIALIIVIYLIRLASPPSHESAQTFSEEDHGFGAAGAHPCRLPGPAGPPALQQLLPQWFWRPVLLQLRHSLQRPGLQAVHGCRHRGVDQLHHSPALLQRLRKRKRTGRLHLRQLLRRYLRKNVLCSGVQQPRKLSVRTQSEIQHHQSPSQ